MYYFDDDYYQMDDLYEDEKYSPIKQILEGLKKDEYKLGTYKKYTTQKINNATNYNDDGVKNYKTEADGLEATYKTITNSLYPNIVKALKNGIQDKQAALDLAIKLSSTEMSNEQHKQINEMITYINDGNYFGDKYRKYLLSRRDANDFWISTFYPLSSKELMSNRKIINKF